MDTDTRNFTIGSRELSPPFLLRYTRCGFNQNVFCDLVSLFPGVYGFLFLICYHHSFKRPKNNSNLELQYVQKGKQMIILRTCISEW